MKPTNEQINQAVANLCGWTQTTIDEECSIHTPGSRWIGDGDVYVIDVPYWIPPGTDEDDSYWTEDCPDYCTDRNALPEVWEYIQKLRQVALFVHFLDEMTPNIIENTFYGVWHLMIASPRLQSIAALKACGKWPEDWEEGE